MAEPNDFGAAVVAVVLTVLMWFGIRREIQIQECMSHHPAGKAR